MFRFVLYCIVLFIFCCRDIISSACSVQFVFFGLIEFTASNKKNSDFEY